MPNHKVAREAKYIICKKPHHLDYKKHLEKVDLYQQLMNNDMPALRKSLDFDCGRQTIHSRFSLFSMVTSLRRDVWSDTQYFWCKKSYTFIFAIPPISPFSL